MELEKKKHQRTKKQTSPTRQEVDGTSLEDSVPDAPVLAELLEALGDDATTFIDTSEQLENEKASSSSNLEEECASQNIESSVNPGEEVPASDETEGHEVGAEVEAGNPVETMLPISLVEVGHREKSAVPQDHFTTTALYPQQDLARELEALEEDDYCEVGREVLPSAPGTCFEEPVEHAAELSEFVMPVEVESNYVASSVLESPQLQRPRERPATSTNIKLLYSNYLLENNEEFVKRFLESAQASLDGFELYELLMNNLRAYTKLTGCEKSLASLKDTCDDLEKSVWTLSTQVLSEKSYCEDNTTVTATYKIHTSEFNQQIFAQLRRTLKEIKELLQDSFSLHTYSVQLSKTQIEHFFYKSFGTLDIQNLHLAMENEQLLLNYRGLLQKCITTLFTFARKPLLHVEFVTNCQFWIERCASLLLRIATIEDHLFVLNHILRCPPKVISKWGAKLIQVPPIEIPADPSVYGSNSFGHLHLDYALTMLQTMLTDVPKREEFLMQRQLSAKISVGPASPSQQWVVVDSDGEDEPEDITTFKESDLIALLQQVPFESIFKRILVTCRGENGEEIHEIGFCSEHLLMKLIAFSVHFVNILSNGFTTFYTDRYRQLVKLLGRLILHTVQYVTDQIESFIEAKSSDPLFLASLSAEYDAFMFGAVETLNSARNIGTLQFLAAIPYHLVSENMLWEMYRLLTKWDIFEESILRNENIVPDFEHELLAISESNAVYMLTTLSAMAMSQKEDGMFVRVVTVHLFQVGFLSSVTKDICSKHVRDLLGHLTRKYPLMISTLIQKIKDHVALLDKMSLFLLKELAFDLWKPLESDVSLLNHWLLNFQPSSLENQIGRFIVQSMNWGFSEENDLFLPYQLHCQMAILVVKAHVKWEHNQGRISEGVKQLSSWISRNPDLNSWAWDVVRRLHLHAFDRFCISRADSFSEITRDLPALEGTRDLEPLRRAVEDKSPIGCAVSLLMTPVGHSVPLLCDKGFDLLDTLVQISKFDIVINVLYFTIPIFADSSEALAETDKFLAIIKSIANADATYVRMAKNLVVNDSVGLVSKLFGEMIAAQLDQFPRFGVTEIALIELWMNVLTKLENWNKDNNILYWIDILARFAYPRNDLKARLHEKFAHMYKDLPTSQASGISSFFGWSSQATTLLPNLSYPQFGYLAYFVFTIETELENSTGFWKCIIGNLNNPKTTVETAIKKASNSCNFATSFNYLTIYRWAQQALDAPLDHPLLFVFWQKFFLRYFQRLFTSDSCRDGVGERFFEGMVNAAFLKKLKKRLHELLEYCGNQIQSLEESTSYSTTGENVSLLLQNQKNNFALVSAMALWIEDPKFHKDSLYITALPPQCQPIKLSTLIEGELEDWSDVVDAEAILSIERTSCKEFLTMLHRLEWIGTRKIARYTPWQNSYLNRRDEFIKRLGSYDKAAEPPPLAHFNKILPELNPLMLMDAQTMGRELKSHFECLNAFAKLFRLQISQHGSLDCSYCDQLPELYASVESEALVNVRCAGGKKGLGCSGPAHVVFQFTEARLNERIGHTIHQNRTEYHELIQNKGVQPPPLTICAAAVFVEDFITNLVLTHRKLARDNKDMQSVAEVGSALFYFIVTQVNEDTNFYPPTRQLYSSFLEIIGFEFIGGRPTESRRLVTTCVQNSGTAGLLAPHINLANCDSTTLIDIYKEIVAIPKSEGDLIFVLLSKLDLSSWLVRVRPGISVTERSQLIALIWKALKVDELSEQGNQMVRDTYRNHLKIMLLFDFPQHFGEILNYLLEDTDNQACDIDLWYDFFNALSRDSIIFRRGMEPFAKKREMKRFATETDTLRYVEVMEVAKLLCNHFTNARLSHGIYGLYPKYKTYLEPISCFLQMVAHLITAASLKNSQGLLSHKVIEIVWPAIRDLYAPWVLPYDEKIIRQKCAQWIQQMNFESGSVLQPFVRNDLACAMTMMSDFTDSVLFLAETVPGSTALFSNLWNFYVDNFAQATAKDYVLSVVHNCFISIPWAIFWPSFSDLESMNKVVVQYLPSCHSFLGVVFAQINWLDWISNFTNQNVANHAALSKCHFYLLNITVNLANDIVARESPTWVTVMETVQHLNWQHVSSNSLEQILNFYVMSIDPRVVLSLDNTHHMDKASFILLKIASGYSNGNCLDMTQLRAGSPPSNKADLAKKRYLFLRSYIRLIVSVSSKYKTMVTSHVKDFERSLQGMVGDLALIIQRENQQTEEFKPHLKEIMNLMTNHYLATIARNAFIAWCENNRNSSCSIYVGIIQLSFGTKVPPFITSPLIEIAIELAFKTEGVSWKSIYELSSVTHNQGEWANYTDVASKDGHFLVLNCLLLQKFKQLCTGGLSTLTTLTDLLKNIKPKEENEAKLPLVYKTFIYITLNLFSEMEKLPGNSLEKAIKKFLAHFIQHLGTLADEKQGWGILGALGLNKSPQISFRGRFLARSLQTFLQVQMPVNSPIRFLPEAAGHFNTSDCLSSSNPTIRANTEILPNLERLEAMKLDRQYCELAETIDAIINIIKDPKFSLSNCGSFINEITSRIFTESYLMAEDSAWVI